MKYCCDKRLNEKKDKKCRRKKDGKIFSLPRRFTRKRCKQGIRGFTMRSSCAPYSSCVKRKGNNKKKSKNGKKPRNRTQETKKIK